MPVEASNGAIWISPVSYKFIEISSNSPRFFPLLLTRSIMIFLPENCRHIFLKGVYIWSLLTPTVREMQVVIWYLCKKINFGKGGYDFLVLRSLTKLSCHTEQTWRKCMEINLWVLKVGSTKTHQHMPSKLFLSFPAPPQLFLQVLLSLVIQNGTWFCVKSGLSSLI